MENNVNNANKTSLVISNVTLEILCIAVELCHNWEKWTLYLLHMVVSVKYEILNLSQ